MGFDVEKAASLLIEARRERRQVMPFSPGPQSPEEAYAVQDAVARRLGPIAGWKVGAKSPSDTPQAAPLFAELVRPAPAEWPPSSLHMIGIEAELAFRLGRDIAPRGGPVPPVETWAAIASMHAAIEIVDTRLANWKDAERLCILADNQSNGGFVYDPSGVPVPDQPLAEAPVHLSVNGRTIYDAVRPNPAGDPRRLVEWLVDHCARTRGGLAAGTMITTGSYTGMLFVERGATVEAAFQGVGEVRIAFP